MATQVNPQMLKALAGSPAEFDSQGLEHPLLDPVMIGAQFLPGAARIGAALAGRAIPAYQALGNAGALFPKGYRPPVPESPGIPVNLPPGISKRDMLTEAERQYKLWEATEQQYLQNNDFANALRAKWGMLKNVGGN